MSNSTDLPASCGAASMIFWRLCAPLPGISRWLPAITPAMSSPILVISGSREGTWLCAENTGMASSSGRSAEIVPSGGGRTAMVGDTSTS